MCFTFFITLQITYIYSVCLGKVKFLLLHFGSSVFWVNHARFSFISLYSTKTLYLCIFLIHSGSIQKMSTASFKLVWNTQESTRTIFWSNKTRCFVILKSFWWRKVRRNLNALSYCFFFLIFEVKVSNFIDLLLEKHNKTKLALNSSQSFKATV